MNDTFQVNAIGVVKNLNDKNVIELYERYWTGLRQLEGFSHLQVVWWAHLTDSPEIRKTLIAVKLFKNAPDSIGIFGTRAPSRPNPIMISTIKAEEINPASGRIVTTFIDAEPGTPVLDIKPYFSMERVKNCAVPDWAEHWPKWSEDAMRFNWKDEINFD